MEPDRAMLTSQVAKVRSTGTTRSPRFARNTAAPT
jgi:hypothetical protein